MVKSITVGLHRKIGYILLRLHGSTTKGQRTFSIHYYDFHFKGDRGSADLKITKSAPLFLNH